MKTLIISAFALSLAIAAPTAVLAQEDKDHHDQGHPSGAMTGPTGGHTDTHHDMTVHHDTGTGAGTGTGGSTHHYSHHHTTTTGHGNTSGMNGHHAHATIDVSVWHKNFQADHHYHWGDYNGPPGYAYQRWGFGQNLPREYWAQNYWITNYLNFGLVAPPDGYVWVRYGPDAILIDEDTGDIIQVEYGVFY
jgi:Ni/Co efflux regulator RcnB